jgi:WD40 repeat protein
MFSSCNNIPVQCQICGFPFAILVAEGVRPAWCPSCGAEFTCSSVEVKPDENPLELNHSPIASLDNSSDNTTQFNAADNIVTKNINANNNRKDENNIDQNIVTINRNNNNYRNNNSASDVNSKSVFIKRGGILLTSILVQVIALLALPAIIFFMATNAESELKGNNPLEIDGEITNINPDLPEINPIAEVESSPSSSNDNSVASHSAVTKPDDIDTTNNVVASDVSIKSQNNTNEITSNSNPTNRKNVNRENDNGNSLFSFIESRPSADNSTNSTNSTDKNKSRHEKKPDETIEQVNIDKTHLSTDDTTNYDSDYFEYGIIKTNFINDALPVSTSDSNLLSNEKTDGDTDDNNNKIADRNGNIIDVAEDMGLLSYEAQLNRAREQLTDSGKLSLISPERSLRMAIQAIKRYVELGQAVPLEAKWILGRAYVMQRWGEALVENIPVVNDMAISSDGQWLWCRCEDNTVWIWDVLRSKRTLAGFKLDSGGLGIVKLVFTPDFRFAIGVGVDGLVRMWNMESSDPARSVIVLRGKVANPDNVQISPDGRWLVVSGIVGEIGQTQIHGRMSGVDSSDRVVDEFTGAGATWLWDLDSIKSKKLEKSNKPNKSTTEISDNSTNSTNSANSTNSTDTTNVNISTALADSTDSTESIESSDLLNSSDSFNAGNANDSLEPVILRGHSKPIRVIRISEDSSWLATGSDDATARIYNLRSAYPGAEQTVLKGHQSGIMSVVFSVKGGWLATGSQDNSVRVWRLSGSKNLPESVELRGHIGWVSSLATDNSGERLASGSFDKTIRIWKIPIKNIERAAEHEPLVIQSEQGSVRKLVLTRDGKILVSLGGDFSLRMWGIDESGEFNLKNTILIRNRSLPITNISFAADDRWLIFNYINQKNPTNSGIRLLHLQLDELLKSAENL